ncbi:glutamate-rich protein 6 [Tachyglossus aculeatus]|uniref:glutamate-rich protein 6 n=1 Tax=Tachyglossus aculeatus TaxID=9261 RepID=UPI0018F303B0|nr:glutamate-rich protein 6 [Tachyglossus aculeatus]
MGEIKAKRVDPVRNTGLERPAQPAPDPRPKRLRPPTSTPNTPVPGDPRPRRPPTPATTGPRDPHLQRPPAPETLTSRDHRPQRLSPLETPAPETLILRDSYPQRPSDPRPQRPPAPETLIPQRPPPPATPGPRDPHPQRPSSSETLTPSDPHPQRPPALETLTTQSPPPPVTPPPATPGPRDPHPQRPPSPETPAPDHRPLPPETLTPRYPRPHRPLPPETLTPRYPRPRRTPPPATPGPRDPHPRRPPLPETPAPSDPRPPPGRPSAAMDEAEGSGGGSGGGSGLGPGAPGTPEPGSSRTQSGSSSSGGSGGPGGSGSAEEQAAHTSFTKIPRALTTFRRESSDSIMSQSGTDSHPEEPLAMQVSIQTETSWLLDKFNKNQLAQKTIGMIKKKSTKSFVSSIKRKWSTSTQDKTLDILCDMEFKEDYLRLLEPSLRTIASVGPPTILAFKPELLQDRLLQMAEESPAVCEFCGSNLQPFPSAENLGANTREMPFCCDNFRELYEFLLQEKKLLSRDQLDLISIKPHAAHWSEADRQRAKERAMQRQQERQMARHAASIAMEQSSYTDLSRQLKTISYQMSKEPPGEWTVKPKEVIKPEEEQMSFFITCCDFTTTGGKMVANQFLEKHYKQGGKFLTMFPDGSAQLFYPSGNLAVLVTASQVKGFLCIVREDKQCGAEIQAVFDSCGKGTCYHPNGNVWINFSILGGQCSDAAGNRVRMWKWSSTLTSRPTVPFKPIFLSLSQYIGVRIIDQDKISVTFLALGQQARFSVGAKVQIRCVDQIPSFRLLSQDDFLLLAHWIRIQYLLDKLQGCRDFPSSQLWDKMKPPSYLASHALKLLCLCQNSELADDAVETVRELIKEPI